MNENNETIVCFLQNVKNYYKVLISLIIFAV